LSWPRITDFDTREAAEIEERRRAERVEIVGVVEGVEHLGIDYLFDPDMMSGAVRNLTRGCRQSDLEDYERFSRSQEPGVTATRILLMQLLKGA
jgi:hypothetical protein